VATHAGKEKINRARDHYESLQHEITSYLNSKPYVLVKQRIHTEQIDQWRVETKFPLSEKVPSILGDLVQNLRNALDQSIYPLLENRVRNKEDICFPINKNIENFLKEFKPAKVGEDLFKLVKSFEPWDGGQYHLDALKKLSNTDKHRHPIYVGRCAILTSSEINSHLQSTSIIFDGNGSMNFTNPNDNAIIISQPYRYVNRNQKRRDKSFKQIVAKQPKFDVHFGYDAYSFSGKSVLTSMKTLITNVEQIVEKLAEVPVPLGPQHDQSTR
jgi:hypothetical protein